MDEQHSVQPQICWKAGEGIVPGWPAGVHSFSLKYPVGGWYWFDATMGRAPTLHWVPEGTMRRLSCLARYDDVAPETLGTVHACLLAGAAQAAAPVPLLADCAPFVAHSVRPSSLAGVDPNAKRGPLSEAHKAKLSKAMKGKKLSEATKAKMSKARTGKKRGPWSEAHKANISK